jgi:hypothetical protein
MQRRQRFVADQRFDLPQYETMMKYISEEFKAYNKGFLSPVSRVVAGWRIESNGGLSVRVSNFAQSLLFASEKEDAAGMNFRAAGLDLITHTLADNSVNYVEVQIFSDTCAPDTVAVWDTTANSGMGEEYTQTVNTVYEERPVLVSNTISFAGDADKLPLAIVTTSGGVITSIVDARKFLFELENDWFFGAERTDRTIGSLKSAYDAITTSIKELKGAVKWYDRPFGSNKILKEYQNMFISGGGLISWEVETPNELKWGGNFDIEIASRPSVYTLPAGSARLEEGEALYIDIPSGEPLTSLVAVVCPLADVPLAPSMPGYSQNIQVLFFRRSNKIISTTLDMPDLSSGEEGTVGEDLPQTIRERLGIVSDTEYEAYISSVIIGDSDSYALALSKIDAQIVAILNSQPGEEVFEVVEIGGRKLFTLLTYFFHPEQSRCDLIVSVNGQIVEQDKNGLLLKDFRKISSNEIEFGQNLPQFTKVKIWKSTNGGDINSEIGGGEGSSTKITVREEGIPVTTQCASINFIGNGVTATESTPGNVNIQINTDSAVSLKKRVFNNTGSIIPAYSCLSWTPQGGVALADCNIPSRSLFAGVNDSPILDGAYGFVVKQGNLAGALEALGATPGDTVYIGEEPGQLSIVAPTGLTDTIFVVGRAEPPDGLAQPEAVDLYIEPEVVSSF